MNQFKRAQVILLPTKNKSKLVLTSTPILTLVNNEAIYDLSEIKSQHLCIISDDKIKEGDWKICLNDNSISQYMSKSCIESDTLCKDCKKIIATTDTSLFTLADCPVRGAASNIKYILPQPSQQFIEKYVESYNKGEVIIDVLVEYEETYDVRNYHENFNYNIVSLRQEKINFKYNLKVNSKDNTITIKKLKDSWNRQEVVELIKKFNRDIAGLYSKDDKWIKENL